MGRRGSETCWGVPAPLLGALLLAGQDPAPPVVPPAAPSAVELGRELCRRIAAAPVLHVVAEAQLLSPDEERPDVVHRWRLEIDTWLAKGGRSRSVLRWSDAAAGAEAPRKVLVTLSDGKRVTSWVEGEASFRSRKQPERFVPYPLPDLFAAFEGDGEAHVPPMADAHGFVWNEELGSLPTVVILTEGEEPAPVTWISFRTESKPGAELGGKPAGDLAGFCTLFPEAAGGETLRAVVRKLEALEHLPEGFPGFAPPQGMSEEAPSGEVEARQD
jgi:hypothetical protein